MGQLPCGFKVRCLCLLILFAPIALTGCSEPRPLSALDYADRLARVLQEVPIDPSPLPRHDYPRQRDLQVTFETHAINLLEFLALEDCELQMVIAERNSSLGRLAAASQRLVHELRFLKSGGECLAGLDDQELALKLRQVLEIKRRELAGRIWLATLGGPEFSSFWRGRGSESYPATARTLRLLRQDIEGWLSGEYTVDAKVLEQRLQEISMGNGGQLLVGWRDLLETLPVATQVLETRHQRRPLCFPGMRSPEAKTFYQVVRTGFLSGLQQDVARLNARTYELFLEVQAIEELLQPAMTSSYDQWRVYRRSLVQDARSVIRSHVGSLEPLLQQCGFL